MLSWNLKNIYFLSGGIILVLFCLLFYHFQATQAQGVEYELGGWLWSDNYGWISLNSKNTAGLLAYKAIINSSNQISGYGWSSNVGWVCFGATCGGVVPTGDSPTASLDNNSAKITGWAKVVALGDDGWIHLRRGGAAGARKGEECYNCQPTCEQWTQQCSGTPLVCQNVAPCLKYSEENYDSCKTCFSETYFCPSPLAPASECRFPDSVSAPDAVAGGSGYACSDCAGNCQKIHQTGTDEYRIVCDSCSACEIYGTIANLENGGLIGWGWNGDVSNGVVGAGWVHFNSLRGQGYIVFPWLQTQFGSIYTSKSVSQKAGVVGNNATYCIFAKDIATNIKTQSCESLFGKQGLVVGVEQKLPTGTDIYRNALGRIDVKGLTTGIKSIGNVWYNKYGQIVETIAPASWTNGAKTLNGKIYVVTGDLTISSPLSFDNAVSSNSGNGLIVVQGDLIINGNIVYNGVDLPSNLKQLASVGWIVKGDVKIAGSVAKAVGAFVVLGNGSDCVSDGADYPKYTANGCGVVFSGDSANPLTIDGLLIAKAFDFRRNYADINQGAEKIVYDGRLIANPPPGLSGFSEGLPVIRDFILE